MIPLKTISIGTVLGPINQLRLIRIGHMRVGGQVKNYNPRLDRITGATYRIYNGLFYASNVNQHQKFSAHRLVLPSHADRWLLEHFRFDKRECLFCLDINIVPCPSHSTGYDWSCKILTGLDFTRNLKEAVFE